MSIPPELKFAISSMVQLLAAGRYDQIDYVDRDESTAPKQIAIAVAQYGRTLVPLPDSAFDEVELFAIQPSGEIPVDCPLWTQEEGRSDLQARIAAFLNQNGSYDCKLYDILVP